MNKNKVTIEKIKNVFLKKKYDFFEKDEKDYNLNIIGIRSSDLKPNTFNDLICLIWKYKGVWNLKLYNATTDPGLYYLQNPMNVKGTAIMVPNQYKKCYEIGLHKEYEALRQCKAMDYYRDRDKDNQFDFDINSIVTEIGYTDIHRANEKGESTVVGKWSAGCMVIASSVNFKEFMTICKNSKEIWGNKFSFTLIKEEDLDNA